MTPNRTLIYLVPIVAVIGCGGDDTSDSATSTTTETTTTTATTTTVTTTATTTTMTGCTALVDGAYDFSGDAFGMMMSADLAMDTTLCTFELSNWNMAMDTPTGGTVAGDTVTFTGAGVWPSCSGDIATNGSVDVLCTDDSTSFTMMPL